MLEHAELFRSQHISFIGQFVQCMPQPGCETGIVDQQSTQGTVRLGGIGSRAQLFQRGLHHIEIRHCRKLVVLYNFRILAPVPSSKKQLHVDLHCIRPDDYTMDSEKNVYTEDDLRQLEQRIDELIDTVGSLKNENSSLRQQKDKLVTERSQLIEKTEMARSRVEAMISRLRSLELGS